MSLNGAGEKKAQQLEILAALIQDVGLALSTVTSGTLTHWPAQALHACGTQSDKQAHTHTHRKKNCPKSALQYLFPTLANLAPALWPTACSLQTPSESAGRSPP